MPDSSSTPDFDQPPTKPQVQTAAYFIRIHDQGPSYPLFLRMHLPWLLIRCLPLVVAFGSMSRYERMRPAMPAMVAIVVYSLYVEFLYPRVVGRLWGAYERIIDWDKARKLAEAK